MSIYPPPTEINDIFNPAYYQQDTGQGISQSAADLRYLRLSGGALTGMCTFQTGLTALNQIFAPSGTIALPSLTFSSDTDTGISNILANQLDFSTSGISRLTISTTQLSSTNPLSLPSGTVSSNSLQIGASGVGIYSSAANTLNFATNSINQLAISTTAITSTLPIFCPTTTSLTSCGLQVGLANTGLQYNGGVLYFGLGGTQMMRFQAAQIYSSAPHNFTNGSVSAPAITNPSYQTTGLSFAAGPILNVSVSGVRRAFWNTTGYAIGDLGDAVARKNFGTYTFTAPNLAQHGTTSTTITYANAFASTPRIYLTTSFNSGTSTYMYGIIASASDVGTTTFKINICNLVNNVTTGDIVVNWIAEL